MDRRQERTRKAIRMAFMALVAERRYETITVADIAGEANIGKSTFYEHYRSKDDMLNAMMEGMLNELAGSVTPKCDRDRLRGLMDHFWGNRRLGRVVFGTPLAHPVRRRLASLMERHLAGTARTEAASRQVRIRAAQLAAGHVGLLNAWLSGEIPADPDMIVGALCASAFEAQLG